MPGIINLSGPVLRVIPHHQALIHLSPVSALCCIIHPSIHSFSFCCLHLSITLTRSYAEVADWLISRWRCVVLIQWLQTRLGLQAMTDQTFWSWHIATDRSNKQIKEHLLHCKHGCVCHAVLSLPKKCDSVIKITRDDAYILLINCCYYMKHRENQDSWGWGDHIHFLTLWRIAT